MQQLQIGAQPDRDAALPDQRPRLGVHEGAAARRKHVHGIAEEPRDHLALSLSEGRLAAPLEDLLDRLAGCGFDLAVGIDEVEPESLRESPTDVGLAGAHQPHQDDRAGNMQLWRAHGRMPRESARPIVETARTRR